MSRVVVVGGGVVGLCVACACAQKGHRVVVAERGAPERDGCSFANAGMIVPSHIVPLASPGVVEQGLRWMWNPASPFHVKPRLSGDLIDWGWKLWRAATAEHVERAAPVLRDLHLASRERYRTWAAQWDNAFELVEKGLLMLCRTDRGLAEEAAAAERARRLGIAAEVLTPSEVASIEPALRMTVAGGVHFPLDAHLTPGKLMAALRRECARLGVELRHHSEVRGWRASGRRIDAADTGSSAVAADEFVLCGGIWSTSLARDLGLRLPMQAGKGYSLTLDDPPARPRTCAILSEARVAMTPMGGALRFGGTMEIAGIDESVNPVRIDGIVRSVGAYLPDFTPSRFATAAVRAGLRPCSPDGLPYIGRFASFDNLSAATGHAMMGLSLAPITGTLMAEIVSGEPPSIAIEALSPDRYGEGYRRLERAA
ncbi:MAG TPA: FAD-dependent oxidoreductase [Casimicrobiaceae bacterium]|nr:FAD-dependent oxidoreductase [Casimicrobiaceae bacterium]